MRDEANRVVLAEKQGELQLELDSIPQPPANEWTWIKAGQYPSKVHTDEWMAWDNKYGDRYEQLNKSLKGMQSIQDRFARPGRRACPRRTCSGSARKEMAGRSSPTAIRTRPITRRSMCRVRPRTWAASAVTSDADGERVACGRRRANGDSVSTITWLGYDAPQDIVKDSPFSHYANDGAPAFNQFLDGLDASHTGDSDPHRTAIGHSYGTTLIGSAPGRVT